MQATIQTIYEKSRIDLLDKFLELMLASNHLVAIEHHKSYLHGKLDTLLTEALIAPDVYKDYSDKIENVYNQKKGDLK